MSIRILVIFCLMIMAVSAFTTTTPYDAMGRYTTKIVNARAPKRLPVPGTNPPRPEPTADIVVMVSNFCNGSFDFANQTVINGTFTVEPPALIQSQFNQKSYLYGFEMQVNKDDMAAAQVLYLPSQPPGPCSPQTPCVKYLEIEADINPVEDGLAVTTCCWAHLFLVNSFVGTSAVFDVIVGNPALESINATC